MGEVTTIGLDLAKSVFHGFRLGRPDGLEHAEHGGRVHLSDGQVPEGRGVGLEGHLPLGAVLVVAPLRGEAGYEVVGHFSEGPDPLRTGCSGLARFNGSPPSRTTSRALAAFSRASARDTPSRPAGPRPISRRFPLRVHMKSQRERPCSSRSR